MKKRGVFDQVPVQRRADVRMRRADAQAREQDQAVCDASRQTVVVRTRKVGAVLLVAAVAAALIVSLENVADIWWMLPGVFLFLSGVYFFASYWLDRHFTGPSVLNDPKAYHEQLKSLRRGDIRETNPLKAAAAEQMARAKEHWHALTGRDASC